MNNIDKYRVAANIAEYHIVSKEIFLRISSFTTKGIIPEGLNSLGQL